LRGKESIPFPAKTRQTEEKNSSLFATRPMLFSLPLDPGKYAAHFQETGFAIAQRVFSAQAVEEVRLAIAAIPFGEEVRRKRSIYGVRNLLEISPVVRQLAASPAVHQFVTPILGEAAFATRAVFFDKVPDANWTLGWHQDSVISVAEKLPVPGFRAWGQKAGVWQVQPPPEILARMVAVRIHLDNCGPQNGPLRVIPGSHRHGWVEDEIDHWKQTIPEVVCEVDQGGIVVMCPLLLHASSKSQSPTHRRVIHIEFANEELPGGLCWNTRIVKADFP
jgi:ectoine hydroxylase-related dioxygenase (phytanoyl-CoA dioxygenase family)